MVIEKRQHSSKRGKLAANSYREKKRDQILSASARLFWRKGYLGTSMEDVARATNLNKASIYYYFPSKADILYGVAVTAGTELLAKAQHLFGNDLPPEEKLRLLIADHLRWHTSYPRFADIERKESRCLPPKLLKSYIGVRDQYEAIYRNVISQGIDRGIFRPISPKIASLFTLGLVNSILRWFKPKGELSPSEIANLAFEYVCNALRNH